MKTSKKVLLWIGGTILVLAVIGFSLFLIYVFPFMKKMKQTSTVQYDKELTLVMGGGGNSGILVSDSLVLVIDTKMGDAAQQLYEQVKTRAGNKPILVVNTHYHPDHSEGNKFYSGQSILAGGNYTKEFWVKEAGSLTCPTRWLKDRMDIPMGTDTATLINLGKNIHTASDVIVYLRHRRMLFTGDVVLNKQCPVLMGPADPDAYVAAFDQFQKQMPVEKIIPGHGELGGPEIIDRFREYFADMKTAASDPSKEAELKAKYKDWGQIPFFMSPGATIRAMRHKMGA